MENVMEAIMVVSLCIAVGVMLCRFVTDRSVHKKQDRFTVITIGIGFVIAGMGKALMDPIAWVFILYIVGAWLSYTAAVFSFPSKEEYAHE